MSKASVKKEILVTICDYCDKEINRDNIEDWASIVRKHQIRPTENAKFLRFFMPSKSTFSSVTTYDFHAECFDKMVRKLKDDQTKGESK